jgi:MSHA biogenesis protein MshE
LGVFELLRFDDALADALRKNDPQHFIEQARRAKDYVPLALSALAYAREGKTSLDEVLRVADAGLGTE